ncbi:MAG: dethiobiotin synthase [Flavobacteriales bacterium]|nr:dethiobiotin synthase [Flavobacteriales bacterium]
MNKIKKYFVTGIGTGVGKTVISAILVEALKADYWKPIQAGDLENSDTIKVKNLISNNHSVIYPESFRLTQPISPHAAAEQDNTYINFEKIIPPSHNNTLIIEGAGGLMVPINNNFLMIDLIKKLKAEVILVSRNYLGSINHTLLTCEILKSRKIPVAGIIFNGKPVNTSEEFIIKYSAMKCIYRVNQEPVINKKFIKMYAEKFPINQLNVKP